MLEIKRERINNNTYRNVMVFAGLAHKHLSNGSGYRVQIIDDEDRRIIQRVQAVMDDLTHEWASLCVDEN